ncbi:hypothetical protein P4605_10285 [Priestia aryabhattai]|uniref:hypothetical protein n=1 Tax=Priestia aryabhattai TaxID=412384 RepID=UPI002E24B392|nr:hypothetical protein [Priestia aryabhattai]
MEKKSVGRNKKLTEHEVRVVIKMYKENIKPMGNIPYSDIHSYANQLYTQGIISNATSDSFWRKKGRLGRTEVDKANIVFSETVTITKNKEIQIPNVVDLVDKKYKDKEELLKHLIFMEKHFRESLDREKQLENKLSLKEQNLQTFKAKLKAADEKNEQLQGLVYRLFRSLSQVNNEEVRKQTDYAMKTVFSSPTTFFEFEEQNKSQDEATIIPIKDRESKTKFSSKFRK